jgi:MFS family permease
MLPPALSHPGFRRYFLGSLLNVNAIWIQRVSLAWLAWDLSGSAGFVGLVAGLSLIPSLFLGPLFGVWVDRTDIIRAAMKTTSSMFLILLVLIALLWLGLLFPSLLAFAALAIGIANAAHQPVRMSLAPRLVPTELMQGVIALTAVNFNMARLVAPVFAGLLIAAYGAAASLAVAVALLLPMLFILPTLTPRPLPAKTKANPSLIVSFTEGMTHARNTPLIWRCILLGGVFTFAARGLLELLPVIADGQFNRGANGLGILTASAGAGALMSAGLVAFTAGRKMPEGNLPVRVSVALLVSQGLVALISVAPNWPVMIGLICALGASSTLVGVSLQTQIQARLADEMRGRVMSLWIVTGFGMAAVGSMVIGAVAQFVGIETASAIFGMIGFLLLCVLMFAPRGTFASR